MCDNGSQASRPAGVLFLKGNPHMSTNTSSLQAVQAMLDERGVRDVKFLFKKEALGLSMSDLEDDLKDVLSKFLAGKVTKVDYLPSEELTQ